MRVPAGVNPAESGAGHFRPAMIAGADAEGRSYDVIFDNTETTSGRGGGGDETQYGGEEEDDEEDGVRADRIVSLSLAPCVSCAARLNLARCRFKGGRHTEVRGSFSLFRAHEFEEGALDMQEMTRSSPGSRQPSSPWRACWTSRARHAELQ